MYDKETTWWEYTCICAWLHIKQHRFSLHICPYVMHVQGNIVEALLKMEVISYTKSTQSGRHKWEHTEVEEYNNFLFTILTK